MADLTSPEIQMMGKYYGDRDLHNNEGFWLDVLVLYADKIVPLPLEYNPFSARRVMSLLNCPPGKCGACCNYDRVPVDKNDIENIINHTDYDVDYLNSITETKDNLTHLKTKGGCPFLKNNVCVIYEWRPNVCAFYPLDTPRIAFRDSRQFLQAQARVKCPASVNLIRQLLSESVRLTAGAFLSPDMTIIPPVKE